MKNLIIAPSILAADFVNLESELSYFKDQENLWLHLDIMDGHFVPNLTFGKPIIKRISEVTQLPLDAHLMVSNPSFHIEELKSCNITNLTFHLETQANLKDCVKLAKKYYPSVGLSIKPNTSVSEIPKEILKQLDLVLVMSVEPGFGGQSFMDNSLEKLTQLKDLRSENNYNYQIQIDGGINESTAKLAKSQGADNLVAGSFIFKNNPQDYLNIVNKLRN